KKASPATAGAGGGCASHLSRSDVKANGTCTPYTPPIDPTARHRPADGHDTACSELPRSGCRVGASCSESRAITAAATSAAIDRAAIERDRTVQGAIMQPSNTASG